MASLGRFFIAYTSTHMYVCIGRQWCVVVMLRRIDRACVNVYVRCDDDLGAPRPISPGAL